MKMPFKKSAQKMEDGFAHLDESRHMQEPDVEREIDMARRCESGHLSYAEVAEDYPFEPISAFEAFGYQLLVKPPVVRPVERVRECDLTPRDTEDYWKDKITGPWAEAGFPEMGQAL
jgi:hypothetical protein